MENTELKKHGNNTSVLCVIVVSCLGFPLPVCVFRGYRTLSKVSVNIYVKNYEKGLLRSPGFLPADSRKDFYLDFKCRSKTRFQFKGSVAALKCFFVSVKF